ncbi:MAG: AAA family ATPase [Bacilli bacterium]|nr:AAA family ATPase [Bacilli bacterium]
MLNLSVGYLFKKKIVTYLLKKWEIFEFVDYVTAICFINADGVEICNILSGNNAGGYAGIINKNANEEDLVFISDDLGKAIEDNKNSVNFLKIRENIISRTAKYYLRSNDGNGVTQLVNRDLINFLEKNSFKEESEFGEEVFEKRIDISTMYASIKKTIISQDEQIMQILTALFKNQKVIEFDLGDDLIAKLKENILIYGSTGTGKTEILKRISKLYNIPIVIEDATSLSETGYQGRKITNMIEDLCLVANGDIKLAEKGILVIDEFDKLAEKSGDVQSHVSRSGVQRALLKLLDGTSFYIDNRHFDSSKLTIIGVGAFTGITAGDDYSKLTTESFVKYGIMRELIGRFSKTIAMNPLEKEDIIKILKNSDFSPLNTYKKLFEMLQVQFEFNNDFIEYIADLAIAKKSGARSLKTVFDDCIGNALFRIFAGEYSEISMVRPYSENDKAYVLTKKRSLKNN